MRRWIEWNEYGTDKWYAQFKGYNLRLEAFSPTAWWYRISKQGEKVHDCYSFNQAPARSKDLALRHIHLIIEEQHG